MAGTKLNLEQAKIEEFVVHLQESEVEHESELRAASDAKLRSWGLSDKMILCLKKTLNELVTVRKIVHGDDAVENLSKYDEQEIPALDLDSDHEFDEDEWHCHGQGR